MPRGAAIPIFFVLSGYLITAGMMREIQREGRISLGGFWLRRFKRLMPAALLTLAAITVWMLWFAPLHQIRSVSTDVWWTLLYVANWHLMATNSYFSDTGAASPLLHMWSLAVEEQFYVAWPLILLAVLGVAVLIIASAVTLYAVYDPASPDRAYMGTDAKAFEPLLGALAAILLTNPGIKQWLRRHHRPLGWIGAAVMVGLFPFLDGPPALYYQWGALVFSIGALTLIVGLVLAEGQELLARVLGWESIAYLTWKWFTSKRSAVLAVALLASMLVAVSFGGGTPLSPMLQKLRPGATLNSSIVLMVGDSVPQRFNPELEGAAAARGLKIASATAGGCAPSGIDIPLTRGEPDVVCSTVLDFQTQALEQFNPGTIVWWSRYELADMRVDGSIIGPESELFWEITEDNLRLTADRLQSDGATLVMVATDRIGLGVFEKCTPEDCHPFLDRLAHHDEYRTRWNAMVQAFAAENDRVPSSASTTCTALTTQSPAMTNTAGWCHVRTAVTSATKSSCPASTKQS